MTRIRMFDYLEQYETLKEEIHAAITRVLHSGRVILGAEVQQFEEEYAAFLGDIGACVGVNSGTDALIVALMALGIEDDDEVITVANTAVPTVSAIRSVGATPVFCDVDPRTCLMDLAALPLLITNKTRAILPVHLFGNVVDVPSIRTIIGTRNIKILEDCAQSHGALLHHQMSGTLGDIAAFSFYPTKNLGAYGDAGLCYSRDPALVNEMRMIRMYGFRDAYYAEREGINSRLDELQAAILRVKLKYLPRYIEQRRALAEYYCRQLPASISPILPGNGVHHSYHLFVANVPNRARVRQELTRRGIDTGIHYPYPIHLMQGYSFLGYNVGSLPHTEALAEMLISLRLYPELPFESVGRVCAALHEIFAE
jgi:dTDP-4-amino-4,6-dideoxygalactose transaminase